VRRFLKLAFRLDLNVGEGLNFLWLRKVSLTKESDMFIEIFADIRRPFRLCCCCKVSVAPKAEDALSVKKEGVVGLKNCT
jgi:hypothetical protein